MNKDKRTGIPTGPGTSPFNDVADPHPSDEEHYDRQPHPGGAHPPTGPDIGPNDAVHDGKQSPRPRYEDIGTGEGIP